MMQIDIESGLKYDMPDMPKNVEMIHVYNQHYSIRSVMFNSL